MKLSVIIPTVDRNYKLLEKCLISLKDQSFRDFETIVVSNERTSSIINICKRFDAKLVKESFGTRGGACNVGAKNSKGEIIIFTDDDCTFPGDWLSKIHKRYKGDRKLSALGGNDIINNNAGFFENALFQIDKSKSNKVNPTKRMRGCNTSYRRKDFFSMNGFNPNLTGIEETELHRRMWKQGYKMIFDPKIFVYHKKRSGFGPLYRRFYTNGKSKTELMRLSKDFVYPADIISFLGVILTFISIVLSFVIFYAMFWFVLLFVYFIAKSFYITLRSEGFRYFFILIPILFVREFSYGLGILRGLIS